MGALKRAVSRAHTEIDELIKRRAAAESRAKALAAENQAAAQALRRCTSLSAQADSVPAPPAANLQTTPDVAAATLRHLVLQPSSPVSSKGPPPPPPTATQHPRAEAHSMAVDQTPRSRLLETSLDVGRRMEEIMSRRGKLQ